MSLEPALGSMGGWKDGTSNVRSRTGIVARRRASHTYVRRRSSLAGSPFGHAPFHAEGRAMAFLITHKAQLALRGRWKPGHRPCESPSFPRKRGSRCPGNGTSRWTRASRIRPWASRIRPWASRIHPWASRPPRPGGSPSRRGGVRPVVASARAPASASRPPRAPPSRLPGRGAACSRVGGLGCCGAGEGHGCVGVRHGRGFGGARVTSSSAADGPATPGAARPCDWRSPPPSPALPARSGRSTAR